MEEGKGDMVLCAGTGMNAAVRDGEESYFVFGDYIEESMQGKRSGTQRIERRRESFHQSGDPAGESKERECGCNTGRL